MSERMKISELATVQKLYEAACDVIESPLSHPAVDALREAAARVVRFEEESLALEHVRNAAAEGYLPLTGDEMEIDCHGTHHNGVDGYWVAAWLWVPGATLGDEDDDDDDDDDEDDAENGDYDDENDKQDTH